MSTRFGRQLRSRGLAARRDTGQGGKPVTTAGQNLKCSFSAALLVGIVLGLAVSPIVRAEEPTFVDNDRDGIDDNLEQLLANRFAPVIFIESDESNYPCNVDWFLARARLQYHEDCGINFDCWSSQITDVNDDIAGPGLTQRTLINDPTTGGPRRESERCSWCDCGYTHPPHRDITTMATDPDGQYCADSSTTGYADQQTFVIPDLAESDQLGSTDPRDWVTYFHAYPTKPTTRSANDGGIMLQYWHMFAYSQLAVAGCGNHGGDWDASIQVQLGPDLQPKGVFFSRHGHTATRDLRPPGDVQCGNRALLRADTNKDAAPDRDANTHSFRTWHGWVLSVAAVALLGQWEVCCLRVRDRMQRSRRNLRQRGRLQSENGALHRTVTATRTP